MEFTPRPWQIPMIQWGLEKTRHAQHGPMGCGKTSAMLYVIACLKLFNPTPTLVVAPKKVALKTWPDEVRKWDFAIKYLKVSVVVGTEKERLAALNTAADIYTVNYDVLDWLEKALPKTLQFGKCIIDESTKIKGYRRTHGSSQARSLLRIIKRTPYVVELSGTPGGNGIQDIWGQMFFLDRGARLGKTFGDFETKYLDKIDCGYFSKKTPKPGAVELVQTAISDICLPINMEKYIKLDEPFEVNINVDLPHAARTHYNMMKKQMYAALDAGTHITALNGAGKTLKCLQIASGGLYNDDKTWVSMHCEKLDALQRIIDEWPGENILVAYHWQFDLEKIMKRFPEGKILKDNTIDYWNKGGIPLMLAHPASTGHGLNLQHGGRIIVFYSHWWSYEERAQMIERIGPLRQHQAGYKRAVYIYNIVAENTVDEDVLFAQKYKLSVDETLRQRRKI